MEPSATLAAAVSLAEGLNAATGSQHGVEHADQGAAVTIAVALAAGMIAQTLARHLRIPGIVLLLGAGVLLGPDAANVVRPDTLGEALQILVGFAVAVILFEGGLNLGIERLRREAKVIRNLLTWGALITAAGGAVAARLVMDWPWAESVLFGTLVIVTGPTVITPLLRRIRLHHRVETVLEAEGVLIDAVGAVTAVVALEVVLGPRSGQAFASGPLSVVGTLVFGLLLGLVAGVLLAVVLRFRKLVPDGLENVFTLALVLVVFQVSNAIVPESGIMTVTAAGVVVGNVRTRVQRDLMEFKEQLTVLFIGMLFVLLAADVRLAEIQALGWPGIATVACLMFLVRPLNIAFSTIGSGLNLREKAFLSWLAPRGIVAAAVASFFATKLPEYGDQLRALVFMVIALTVVVQGISGGIVARVLGLRRQANRGYAIVGANELGHVLGRELRELGQEVVFVDSNPSACNVVREDDFRVVYGNALEERTLQRAEVEDRVAMIAVTTSAETNFLIATHAVEEFKIPQIYIALRRDQSTVSQARIRGAGHFVLFGKPRDLELWAVRLRRELAQVERWRRGGPPGKPAAGDDADRGQPTPPAEAKEASPFDMPEGMLLPLILVRGERPRPVAGDAPFKKGDVVHFAVFEERADEARSWLLEAGWTPAS